MGSLDDDMLDEAVLGNLALLESAGAPGLVQDVISMFVRDAPDRARRIRAAARAGDWPALARESHALRGSAGAIGARRVRRVCEALEASVRKGAIAEEACDGLDAAVAAACAALLAREHGATGGS